MVHEPPGADRRVLDSVPWEEFDALFEYASCDHAAYCCTHHRSHTMPHRGCMLR